MKKKSKLLHVVSIIVIVFGALAVISSIFTLLMKDLMTSSYEMLGMTPPPTMYYIWMLIMACIELAAGIIGVVYKSRKSVFITAVVYLIAIVADLIYATGHKTIGYSSNNEVLRKSDASPIKAGAVVPFYHSDDEYTDNFNKEHTWPNSRGAGKSGPGADPHMLRPTISSENSSRGNDFYGPEGNRQWDPGSLGFEGARGEAARIIFYVATRYYANNMVLSNNPNDDWNVKKSMGTLKYLVEWNNQYPVTDTERRRNDYLEKEGFGPDGPPEKREK